MASRALSLKLRYGFSLLCIVPPNLVCTLESYSSLYITICSTFGGSMRHIELVDFHRKGISEFSHASNVARCWPARYRSHCFSLGFCVFLIMTAGMRIGS